MFIRCVAVWIRDFEGYHHLIPNMPLDADCRNLYRIASNLVQAPANSILLSNGVKIIRHSDQLLKYASCIHCEHGLNLECTMKTFGGGGSNHAGELSCGLYSNSYKLAAV